MSMRLAFRFDTGTNYRYLIARMTGKPVHVVLVIGERAYEADTGGVRCVEAYSLMHDGGDWCEIVLPSWIDESKAEAWLTRELGKRYDWWGAIVAWWFGKPAGNGHKDKWFCSELIAAALHVAGDRPPVERYAYWTPRRLYDRWKHFGVVTL